MLNQLTIVIPTRNRSHSIKKQIDYIKSWGSTIYVLDGSDMLNNYIYKLSETFPHINYIHNLEGIATRINNMKNKITTKYTMMMGDDEFFIKNSIKKCIEFLENNSDYASCSGVAIAFKKSNNKKKVIFREIYPKLINYHIPEKSPKDRVVSHFTDYVCSSVYGVIHTKSFDKIVSQLKLATTSCPETTEIWFEATISYIGKIKVLPILYWFRSIANPVVREKNFKRSIKFYEWYNKNKYKKEKFEFIVNFCTVNKESLSNFFNLALSNYANELKKKGHGSIKKSKLVLFFKKATIYLLIKFKIYKFILQYGENKYMNHENMINYLNKKKISYDIESIKNVEKKIIQ